MPRTARSVEAGGCYHVLNRGNGRMHLFHKDGDYDAFLRVLAEAQERYPVDLLSFCLTPNHWHLVLRPRRAAALGRFMGWLGVTHVRRHHEHYHTRGGGHLYQGRYKSFPIQGDAHLLTVLRYVEANALRAGLVEEARQWRWGSLHQRELSSPAVTLAAWPLDRPGDWEQWVNGAMGDAELAELRTSVNRGRPYGEAGWVTRTARRLGLLCTLRPRGRPPRRLEEAGERRNNQ